MLAIRMQRTGRSGHAQFRLIVQDSRFSPTSGRVVAQLGSYDPHSKVVALDKEKAATYLSNGAQPSDSVVKLLKKEGVKLPDWVKEPTKQQRAIRNPEKLRRNRPAEEVASEATEAEPSKPAEAEAVAEPTEAEAPAVEETAEAETAEAETAVKADAEPAAPVVEEK